MKTFLIGCIATAAFATAAFAQDAKPTTAPGDMPGDHQVLDQKVDGNAKTVANDKSKTVETKTVDTKSANDSKSLADAKSDSVNDRDAKSVGSNDTDKAPAHRAAKRHAGIHHAEWKGGRGSNWKMGHNRYGFEGSFGGCHYHGFAGPHGYHIDKSC